MSITDTYRFCYNWGLAFSNKYKETNFQTTPSFITLSDEFTKYRDTHPWLQDFDINTCRYALMNVVEAFDNFFSGVSRYPKFKSKKRRECERKFKVRGDRLTFWGKYHQYVHIPGFGRFKKDRIYCGRHTIPTGQNVEYHNPYIKFDGDNFWLSLSICMEVDDPIERDPWNVVGIDVGIRTTAYLSNGTTFDLPSNTALPMLQHRRRVLDTACARDIDRRKDIATRMKTKYEKISKSKNQLKREEKRRKTYRRIANIYDYHYHVIAKQISKMDIGTVVIENLRVHKLFDNVFTNDVIYQARLGTLLEYIRYKCEAEGIRVIKAPRDFPSTQTCSICGTQHKVGESKTFRCPNCGAVLDRDYNASMNLRDFGIKVLSEAQQCVSQPISKG